jgi:transposase
MSRPRGKSSGLPIVKERAAAIDIGSRFHVVAVPPDLCDEPVQSFLAFTADLHRMADWLVAVGIKTVAMESTGVYWIPVYEILDDSGLEVIVVNARESRAVPGRKSDVNDAQWLQRLHACGLSRPSFRPSGDIAALRAYLRLRERHLDYAAAHIQHMQKALTFMNLQLQDRSVVLQLNALRDEIRRPWRRSVRAALQGTTNRAAAPTSRAIWLLTATS